MEQEEQEQLEKEQGLMDASQKKLQKLDEDRFQLICEKGIVLRKQKQAGHRVMGEEMAKMKAAQSA